MDPEKINAAFDLLFLFAKDAIIRKSTKKNKKRDKKGGKANDKKNDDKWILIF